MIAARGDGKALLRRLVWHLNRTSLAGVVKASVVARHLREKRERKRQAKQLDISPAIAAKAAELNRDGYVMMTELAEPLLQQRLSQESRNKLARADRLATKQVVTHKGFWVRLLDQELRDGMFDSDNLFVRYALQPSVVALVSQALGELPLLVDVLLTLSHDSPSELSYSQLWHRDYDDVRTLKAFTYLTDVLDVADGPFTFLPRSASAGVGFTMRSHLTDEDLFRRVSREEVRTMTGRALTTFVVETSRCLHMGSRIAPGHMRLMYTATFISAPNVYPSSGKRRFRASGLMNTTERLLLGL